MLTDLAAPLSICSAAMFAYAATMKLRRPATTRSSVAGFGLPAWVARVLAPVELVAAVLLLVVPRVGAIVVAALIVAFSALIVRSLRRGVAVRCGCFGGSDDRPVGADALLRNLAILIGAAFVGLGPSQLRAPGLAAALVVAGAGTIVLLIVALLRLRIDTGAVFAQRLHQYLPAGQGAS